jgi:hypothetical protein
MSEQQPGRRPPAKSGGGGAPMGSTISIIVAVVAVVVGFVILKNINDDSGASSSGSGVTPDSTGTDSTAVDVTSTTPSTVPQIPVTAAPDFTQTVVVANASGVGGVAGQMSTALAGVGFTMGTPANATGVESRLDISKVYFLGGGEGTAASVAAQFGGIQAVAMPTAVPIQGEAAALGGATVLLMLGKDFGGKPLPALSADSSIPAAPLDSSTSSSVAG